MTAILILLALLVLSIGGCVYMLYRSKWVYNVQVEFIEMAHKSLHAMIIIGVDTDSLLERVYDKTIANDDVMYRTFWEWDANKFIIDKSMYIVLRCYNNSQYKYWR